MTELEKELTIKVKRLEDDCKAYNFTQHTLQEKIKELEAIVRNTKAVDESFALQSIQLIKAKDLLLRFIELKDKPCAVGHSVNMLLYENISADAKQFLQENK